MRWHGLALGASLTLLTCGVSEHGVPDGKLAVVGSTVFGPEDLLGVGTQLGPYAQLRFAGVEGRMALLESLVAAELMAQQAVDEGFAADPRVQLALWEEEAGLVLAAEMERRVPQAEIAAQPELLRAYYEEHPELFWTEEQRNLEAVMFTTHDEAGAALRQLREGEVALSELGEQVATPLQARDDREYPGFHSILFEEGLVPGDWISAPVVVGRRLLVGSVQQVVPARRLPLDDPEVQQQLVHAVRGPRVAQARAELLAELAAQFPEQAP